MSINVSKKVRAINTFRIMIINDIYRILIIIFVNVNYYVINIYIGVKQYRNNDIGCFRSG